MAVDSSKFTQTVQQATNFEKIANAFAELAKPHVGAKLLTLTRIDYQHQLAERIYSNMPDAYPVSGTKPMVKNSWAEHVLDNAQIFRSNTLEGLAEVFSDFELIQSLGCESVLNFPVSCAGQVIGTVNFLHEAGFYNEPKEALANELYTPALTCFLAQSHLVKSSHG
ncbi:MAG: GAF domain-containing protein [Deinococcota bacterium]